MRKLKLLFSYGKSLPFLGFLGMKPCKDVFWGTKKLLDFLNPSLGLQQFGSTGVLILDSQSTKTLNYL